METQRGLGKEEKALRQSGQHREQCEKTGANCHGPMEYLKRIFRWPRLHFMRLDPIQDIRVENGQFHSIGNNPQFILHSTVGHLPAGWVEISYLARSSERWVHPTLYVDTGSGFSQEHAIPLMNPVRVKALSIADDNGSAPTRDTVTPVADVQLQFLVSLPRCVRALRLDPLSFRGSFVLQALSFREVGMAHVVQAILRRHLAPVWHQPRLLQHLVRFVWQTLQMEGVRGLQRHFFFQGQADTADYEQWVRSYDTVTEKDRSSIRRHLACIPHKPRLSMILSVHNTPEDVLRQTIESVRRQLYDNWELCIADDASAAQHVRTVLEEAQAEDTRIKVTYRETSGHIAVASNSALALATGEYVGLLEHDAVLAEHALYMVAVELNAYPEAALLYSDEDKITEHGVRHDPYFKPDWNPDLFLCQNIVNHLGVYRTAIVREVGGFRPGYEGSHDWDLALRVVKTIASSRIRHIPHVLYHRRVVPGSSDGAVDAERYTEEAQAKSLRDHFRHTPEVQILSTVSGHWRVKYPLPPTPPLVSVIIPTRDRLDLLARCLGGIHDKTLYPNCEVIIVDNQSENPQTLSYLQRLAQERRVTVLRYAAPFNFSAINNFAVRHAHGTILGFLNNDLDVISPHWLEEMVSQALRPEIGAVGALLYYPDDTVQHAGVILGVQGVAKHAYSHLPRGVIGQVGRAGLVQNFSAVTAACLVVRRSVFEEVGGFDEQHLPVAFNDVDLCLRIQKKGYRNVWTPYAELYHYESASRGYEDTFEKQKRFKREIDYMLQRWGELLQHDPTYNPNLTLERGDFTLAFPPRTKKPW